MSTYAIVLAAGKGTRMRSDLAKVLHEANGRTLLDWSLSALADLLPDSVAVVVGHQAGEVTASIADHELAPIIATALQAEQLGTGHAAGIGLAVLNPDPTDTIVVMPGDMPLLQATTLASLVGVHESRDAVATVLASVFDDPTGYGRIKRVGAKVVGIVEQADATPVEEAIREVNTSVYAFQAATLARHLDHLDTDNSQGEQYLTDVIGMIVADGDPVYVETVDPAEAHGVNNAAQLAAAAGELKARG